MKVAKNKNFKKGGLTEMKKGVLFKLICILLLLSIVTGCSLIGSNPKTVLSKYLDANLAQNHSEAYKYVSESDKSAESLEEFSAEDAEEDEGFGMLVKILFKKVSYKIKDITVLGDKATANVEMTLPDIESIFADIFIGALGEALSGKSAEEMEKAIGDKIAEKYKDDIPMTTEMQTFNLVKDKDGWKVFLDWEKAKRIETLLAEADKLMEQSQFEDALAKYNEVLAIDPSSDRAKQGKEDAENKIEKKLYISTYLEIKSVEVEKGEYSSNYLVFGEIVNHGNRTLKEVEITVYYLDKDKKAIGEEKHYPVSEYSWSDNAPLKPNYIKEFDYYVGDDIPSGWSTVSIAITNIEFEE